MSRASHNRPLQWLPVFLALIVARPELAAAQADETEEAADDEAADDEAAGDETMDGDEEAADTEASDDNEPADGTAVDGTATEDKDASGEASDAQADVRNPGVDEDQASANDHEMAPAAGDQAARDTAEGRVFVGSRAARHTVPWTTAPVVVLTSEDLMRFHGPSLLMPASLRGLGPDRVLVLVNGKRRHQMAQINISEEVGRGSSGTDLNGIPIGAIERVEILRDSAAALYGPNAIGGVINIVLKERRGLEVQATAGNYYQNDGNAIMGLDMASASVNGGFALGDKGFLNLTLEVRDRGETNRADITNIDSTDGRLFGGNWWAVDSTCPPDPFDPEVIPPCVPVRRQRQGNADGQDYYLFYNGSYDLSDVTTLYSFGGVSRRIGKSGAGLYLGTGNGRVPAELYPDGFLPELVTTVDDMSATAGARFAMGGPWELDVSGTYGQSRFDYDVQNSVNTSWFYEINPNDPDGNIFGTSPTSANAGQLLNTEVTANLDLRGEFDVLESLKVGAGTEVRADTYQIVRGDYVSYSLGRANVVDNANPIYNTSAMPLIEPVVGGIQGFPGFSPEAEVIGDRFAWGTYVDAEQSLTDSWLVAATGRVEHVEFTGDHFLGRLATRVDLTDFISLRASGSNGSRSPDVQKIYFSQKLTAILPAGLTETVTAGDANPLRSAFGLGQLKPEKSLSASGGIVLSPKVGGSTRSLTLTAGSRKP